MEELDRARYVSLTTFKRDGSPVSTPVWITGVGGTYAFTTGDKAWKTKRLARDPSVRVQACSARGRVTASATIYEGTGTVLDTPTAISATERALREKYGWQFRATKIADALSRVIRKEHQNVVAVELTLTDASARA